MQFKDWSALFATWITIAVAVVGGYVGLSTYRADIARRSDARVVQTFDLYSSFYGPEMMRLRARIAGELHPPPDQSVAGQSPQAKTPGIQLDQDLFAFIDYFDAVQICEERNLCDADLVNQLFGPYAQGMYPDLASTISQIRESEERAGLRLPHPAGYGLEKLAGVRGRAAAPHEHDVLRAPP